MQNMTGITRRCEQNFVRSHLEKYDLLPMEGLILHIIQHHNQCNQDVLCASIGIDKGRVAKAMAHLESLDLIHRLVNVNNKREKLTELTEKGMTLVTKIDEIFQEWNEICFAGFSEEERKQYQSFLERIAQNALENRRREKENG